MEKPTDIAHLPASALDIEIDMDGEFTGTLRELLKRQLIALWKGGLSYNMSEGLGGEAWHCYVWIGLVKAGVVEGTFNEHDELEWCDEELIKRLVTDLISNHLFKG